MLESKLRERREEKKNILSFFTLAHPTSHHQPPPFGYSPFSDTYIIFGEAKLEDLGAQAQSAAAAQFSREATAMPSAASMGKEGGGVPPAGLEEDGDVDETGVEAKDIELVMSQAGMYLLIVFLTVSFFFFHLTYRPTKIQPLLLACVCVSITTGCSRARAVAALKKNEGDIVNAIMELTV